MRWPLYRQPNCLQAWVVLALAVILVTACGGERDTLPASEPTEMAVAPTATPSQTPTATATTAPSATPTPTATPGPLAPAAIFDQVSKSIAFIETESGTGSGVLVENGYLATNAHVVWPFDQVRVVFPDGSEFKDAPVAGWDLIADLAVVGPLDTDLPAVDWLTDSNMVIGSQVYLIGYPGEVDEFPQPTMSGGLIARLRSWESQGIGYFQTDADLAGGQSGGVLVSEMAKIIGISGFTFADSEFGLVISAVDMLPRLRGLIAGEDVDGLGARRLPQTGMRARELINLLDYWDTQSYVLLDPADTEVTVKLESEGDSAFVVRSAAGDLVGYADEGMTGREQDTFEIEADMPYFLEVYQYDDRQSVISLSSSVSMWALRDPDKLSRPRLGETLIGSIDYPGDTDVYRIHMNEGELLNIQVESVMIDPYVTVDVEGVSLSIEQLPADDDSGDGLFGWNAELTYQAPQQGIQLIVVESISNYQIGGYALTIGEPYEGAPTPMAPEPTATPITSDFGDMALFSSDTSPSFTIQHPADWTDQPSDSSMTAFCNMATACYFAPESNIILIIALENLDSVGLRIFTVDDYVELLERLLFNSASVLKLSDVDRFTNASGQRVAVLSYTVQDTPLQASRMVHIREGFGFNATLIYLDRLSDEETDSERSRRLESIAELIDYLFDSFDVVDD